MKLTFAAAILTTVLALPALAQDNPMVGGAPMFAEKNIVDNAVNSADHTTLVAAVQAAGLVETLQSPGPFTVFAPTDAAFTQVPPVTRDGWMRPAQQSVLVGVLNYHVVPGKMSSMQIAAAAKANDKDLILVIGSVYLVAEVNRALFKK